MNTKEIARLLTHIKEVRPGMKEEIEELRFGCIWKNMYTSDINETGIEICASKPRGGNFYSMLNDMQVHFPHTSQIEEIIGNTDNLLLYVSKALGEDYIIKGGVIFELCEYYNLETEIPPLHQWDKEFIDTLIGLIK